MKIVAILLAATLLGGCATCCYEDYGTPNPNTNVQVWGHASGDNWSLTF